MQQGWRGGSRSTRANRMVTRGGVENWALQQGGEGVFQTLFSKSHLTSDSHGQPQKEAPSPDEQAQAPQALEVQSSQKAHLAKVRSGFGEHIPSSTRPCCGVSVGHRFGSVVFLRLHKGAPTVKCLVSHSGCEMLAAYA